jgi:hypothetical protein
MATSIRSRRISELQGRAKRTDILWMNRRNALHCLTGIHRLGEKTQVWCQRLIYSMREQYSDLETQKELDVLQERLDHQKELLKKRLARKGGKESGQNTKRALVPEAPASSPLALWQEILDRQKEKPNATEG